MPELVAGAGIAITVDAVADTITISATGGGGTSLPVITLSPASVSHAEGASGSTAFVYTATRTGDSSGSSSAAWAVTGTGANPANAADFTGGALPSGTVSFAAGETIKTITVNVAGDSSAEPDEGFTVTLSAPVNATIGTAAATGTITNDDSAPAVVANKVVLLGDSICAGVGGTLITQRPDLAITNLAVSGASLNGYTPGSPDVTDLAGANQLGALLAMTSARPEVVLIACGANDLPMYYTNNGNNGTFYEGQRKSVLIDAIRAFSPATKIVIATVLARADHAQDVYNSYGQAQLDTMNAARAADRTAIFAAKTAGIIDAVMDYEADSLFGRDDAPLIGIMRDGVHPSAEMNPRLAELYANAIMEAKGTPATTPYRYYFQPQAATALNTDVLSAPITVEHLGPGRTGAISGRYTINSSNPANIQTSAGTVSNGDLVRAANHSASTNGVPTDGVVSIGAASATFSTATPGITPVAINQAPEGIQSGAFGGAAQVDTVATLPAGILVFCVNNDRNFLPSSIQVFAPSDTGKTSPITANRIDGGLRTVGAIDFTGVYSCVGAETGAYTFRLSSIGNWGTVTRYAVSFTHASSISNIIGWNGEFQAGGDKHIFGTVMVPKANGMWFAFNGSGNVATWASDGFDAAPVSGSVAATGTWNINAAWGVTAGKPRFSFSSAAFDGQGVVLLVNP